MVGDFGADDCFVLVQLRKCSAVELPPGYDPVLDAKPKPKSAKRNERKKEKKQQVFIYLFFIF